MEHPPRTVLEIDARLGALGVRCLDLFAKHVRASEYDELSDSDAAILFFEWRFLINRKRDLLIASETPSGPR